MVVKRKMSDNELAMGVAGFLFLVALLLAIRFVDFGPQELVLARNICIKEVNKQYVSPGKDSEYIYKIDRVRNDKYAISSYSNRDWVSLGDKEIGYFKEGKVFRFENIECPGNIKNAKLGDRLKSLEFRL